MGELKIDFKVNDIDDIKTMSAGEIEQEIVKILKKTHKDASKQEISYGDGRLKIACPYCGDSKTTLSKKRGNIYLKTNTYKCWNGGCFKFTDLKQFFIDFGSDAHTLIPKFDLSEFVNDSGSQKVSIHDMYDIKSQVIDRQKLMGLMGLTEIVDHYKTAKYLQGRVQNINDRRMAVNTWNGDIVFFNMSLKTNKVIGIQIRKSTPPPNGSRFISFHYSRLMEKILKEPFDEDMADKIKMISLTYNIMNVDISKDINIFESSLNSHHIHNSVACWGSNNLLKVSNGWYCFDDDVAGRKSSTELLNNGLNVFMWTKFKKDFPIYKDENDFNDVFIKKPVPLDVYKKYFTNSKLDVINI